MRGRSAIGGLWCDDRRLGRLRRLCADVFDFLLIGRSVAGDCARCRRIFGISEDGDSSPSCTCLRGSSGNSTRAHASSPSRTRPLTSYKRSDNARSPSRMHPRFKRRWVCRLPCTPLQPERPHRRQSAYTHQPIARRVRVFFRLALCSIPEIDLHPPLHTLEKEKPRYLFNSGESFVCMVPER